jgi:phosphohistidine phosphatase
MNPAHRSNKTLLILRHAKAQWGIPAITDHDLSLTPQGEADARQLGSRLHQWQLVPEMIITSTAERAQDTARIVADHCHFTGKLYTTPLLYYNDPDQVIELLRKAPERHNCIMIVGHSPGLGMLLAALTGEWHQLTMGSLARITLPTTRWQALGEENQTADLEFYRPQQTASLTPTLAVDAAR